jgi:hypothetical protein
MKGSIQRQQEYNGNKQKKRGCRREEWSLSGFEK